MSTTAAASAAGTATDAGAATARRVTYPLGGGSGTSLSLSLSLSSSSSSSSWPSTSTPSGTLLLYGPSTASTIALLCAGFPDDHSAFVPLAERLSRGLQESDGGGDGNVLVGVTCLPGYDDRPSEGRPWTSHKRDGYTFDEWATSLREAAKALRAESDSARAAAAAAAAGHAAPTKAKLVGIFHDWGVVAGLMCANRTLQDAPDSEASSSVVFDGLVLFDVLLPPHPRGGGGGDDDHDDDDNDKKDAPIVPAKSTLRTVRDATYQITYRIVLACVYLSWRYVHDILARFLLTLGFAVLGMLRLTPTRSIDAHVMQSRNPPLDASRMAYMSYPYFGLLKAMLTGTISTALNGAHMPPLDQMPVLYMYGTDKNVMFHDDRSVSMLKRLTMVRGTKQSDGKSGVESETPQNGKGNVHADGNSVRALGRVIAVDGAGHWLYLQKPDLCLREIKNFLSEL